VIPDAVQVGEFWACEKLCDGSPVIPSGVERMKRIECGKEIIRSVAESIAAVDFVPFSH
jgi:hypothetical protein